MAGKPDQVLEIEPPTELTFVGPFTAAVSAVMRLRNPSEKRVCFKIKTTAPKRYCVKPNSGVIEGGSLVQISVSLQPFDFDPNEKNRHKFMVQSMFAPDGEYNQETLWKETDGGQVMDSKLKCVFVLPDGDAVTVNSSNSSNNSNSVLVPQMAVQEKSAAPPSPKVVGESDTNLKRTVDEIKKLQEEVSALRQENIQLKEEALRQKRLAASANRDFSSSSSASHHSASSSSPSPDYSATTVIAGNPNAAALNPVYLYIALAVLVLGMIIGKWII